MTSTTQPPAHTTSDDPGRRDRIMTYAVAGVILALLIVIASIMYEAGSDDREARDKADQLVTVFEDAGYPAPDEEAIVSVFGNDGGAVCESPGKSLAKAALHRQISNGAAGPGMRPVIADGDVLRGQVQIMQIYCPDALPDVRGFIEDLKTDDVVNE
jgi:hypothetical protein